jgi:galactose mutarotase-like enzyme
MVSDGCVLGLEHEYLRVEIVPDRGAEIRFLGDPRRDENVLATWDAPAQARPAITRTIPASEADWLARYRGGWQETFPNAGDGCDIQGIPLPFHGELSSEPWELTGWSETTAELTAVSRLSLRIERRMRLVAGSPVLQIEETVVNEGQTTMPFIWGHHPAFEALPDMHVDLPDGPVVADGEGGQTENWPAHGHAMWSRIPAAGVTRTSLHYLPERRAAWSALRHPASGRGVALSWDPTAFPHVWLWQQVEGAAWPWPGRARIVATEPHSAWPRDGLSRAQERGRHHQLAPGERRTAWLTTCLFGATRRRVRGVGRDGSIQLDKASA